MSWRGAQGPTHRSLPGASHGTGTKTTECTPIFTLRAAADKAAALATHTVSSTGTITRRSLLYGSLMDPEAIRTTTVSLYWRDRARQGGSRETVETRFHYHYAKGGPSDEQ